MRLFVRTTVLASTAAFAAAVGAVALAPMALAEEPAPAPSLGSAAMPDSPDLVVTVGATCAPFDDEAEADTAAFEIVVKNVGKGDAADVATNFAVLPDVPGVFNEKLIKAGEEVKYTVPSKDLEWVSRPAGAAVFSPQLDGNYADNVAFGMLSVDCVLSETAVARLCTPTGTQPCHYGEVFESSIDSPEAIDCPHGGVSIGWCSTPVDREEK
jgi:hypothetical protein